MTVLSDAHGGHAGLPGDDVFYFGNAIGESGNSASDAVVDESDVAGARDNPHGPFNRTAIDDPYDYNRDRRVYASDMILARENQTTPSTSLQLITVPGVGGTGSLLVGPEFVRLCRTAPERIPAGVFHKGGSVLAEPAGKIPVTHSHPLSAPWWSRWRTQTCRGCPG